MANNLTVTYKGNEIHTASASGSATLNTEGKYMEDNVTLDYTFESGGSSGDDVIFIDYDGTVLHSYSATDFANLSEMPANPSHTGLTAQGWNWTLADAKSYVADYGMLVIGQHYTTNDGKTRIYITLVDGRLAPKFGLAINGTIAIDWGDGTSDTLTGTSTSLNSPSYIEHTYSASGNYIIEVEVTTGAARIYGINAKCVLLTKDRFAYDYSYQSAIQKVEIGSDISIGSSAFAGCFSLESITIPSNAMFYAPNSCFSDCYNLKGLVLPTSTPLSDYIVGGCRSLYYVSIPKMIGSVNVGQYAFNTCSSLKMLTIPEGITTIEESAISQCRNLHRIVIPNGITTIKSNALAGSPLHISSLPSSVTVMASILSLIETDQFTFPNGITSLPTYLFNGNTNLRSATFPQSITKIYSGTFDSTMLKNINIPEGITEIEGRAFYVCKALVAITLPSTLTTMQPYTFYDCRSLSGITIPTNVTSIGNYCFYDCYGLGEIRFEGATPPTIGGSSAFGDIPRDCKIYVPRGSLSAYTSATNYPNSNKYTYVEYDP